MQHNGRKLLKDPFFKGEFFFEDGHHHHHHYHLLEWAHRLYCTSDNGYGKEMCMYIKQVGRPGR